MKSIVVAIDQNNGIGADNDLLWLRDLPDDLAHFRSTTMGGTVVMGRRTFDGIGKPLSGRENIVVTSHPGEVEGVIYVNSLDEAYEKATNEIFVIGGGRVYADAIDDMDILYVTEVQASFPQASVFFPAIDKSAWREEFREHHDADERNKYAYEFVKYVRS